MISKLTAERYVWMQEQVCEKLKTLWKHAQNKEVYKLILSD
jgi:hypothetical protein